MVAGHPEDRDRPHTQYRRHAVDLRCHLSGRAEQVHALSALVSRSVGAFDELRISYRLEGDLGRIRLPAPRAPRIASDLWRHTCFEAFIAVEGQPAYHEFNFSPSGEWAVFAFSGYREG